MGSVRFLLSEPYVIFINLKRELINTYFGPIQSISVQLGPLWSFWSISVLSVQFDSIQSIRSSSVHFVPIMTTSVHSANFGPLQSMLVHSVQFGHSVILVHLIHFGPLGLLQSIWSNSVFFSPLGSLWCIWSISVQFRPFGSAQYIWSSLVYLFNLVICSQKDIQSPFGLMSLITQFSVSITHNSKMVGPIANSLFGKQ